MRVTEEPRETGLYDKFGRVFPYLRLSITDVCNFRCQYCLPNGYRCDTKPTFLTSEEITRLVHAFAALGMWKVRITGGEPTVRKDFTDIVQNIAAIPGITQLAFTTNGYRLKDHAHEWKGAGLTHINISVDSLDPDIFYQVTGHNRLGEVLDGVAAAKEAGFDKVKINVVLLKGVNDKALESYLAWAKNHALSIRFIELMQTGDNLAYFNQYHVSSEKIKAQLLEQGWVQAIRPLGAGPAIEYTHPDYQGTIGIIAPYSKDFCASCNRLRVTATGDLRLCLFGELGVPLKPLLQRDEDQDMLLETIQKQLAHKKMSHFLHEGETGMMSHLASVGG